jgi:formylglycine-generating enzyme required for sulfatase activity
MVTAYQYRLHRGGAAALAAGWLLASAAAIALHAAEVAPAALRLGVLLPAVAEGAPRGERDAALAVARGLGTVLEITVRPDGTCADGAGGVLPQEALPPVLWHHQGDTAAAEGPVYTPAALATLKAHVTAGGGLFLSGAALGLVNALGAEPAVPRRGGPGDDQVEAAVVPVVGDHPVFRGLGQQGGAIPLSSAGYPAFADFHGTDGPFGGMLLGRSPAGVENPLVEYGLGQGRVVAMGWRLPHYANLRNPHRRNLVRLTGSILGYLGDPAQWQKIVIRPATTSAVPAAAAVGPGLEALERAVRDLTATIGAEYPGGPDYLERLGQLRQAWTEATAGSAAPPAERLAQLAEQLAALRQEALLANPLLRFPALLLVKRHASNLGLPQNWQSNSCLPRTGYDNEIAVLSPVTPGGELRTLYRPPGGEFVGDVDLDFDAGRLLFSMPGPDGRWQVFELPAPGGTPQPLPLIPEADVNCYDACYLPDGNVLFTSTAPFVGVPCVTGSSHVTNLFRFDRADGRVRQLTFDQDHNWCPTVLDSGRVLYLRWEYSDLPHFVARILFQMNPDGTGQMEYYGSNSYWPNAMFYARPVPGTSSRFVAVVGGHHDVPRMGELVLFDTALGRHEADGAVQRIPGWGQKVKPVILDGLVQASWPKFLHPWPLAEAGTNRGAGRYVLVAAKLSAASPWGLYVADVFDNLVLVKELPGYALLEPVPLQARSRPPVVPPRVDLASREAVVYLTDVYQGPGLRGVPRGTVKALRLFTYHFAYHGMGGQVNRVGLDGPWDIKRVVGTVPVETDGSALFRVPANTPISVQPLDGEGKALQLMRSWFTAMPGEVLSCVGCHEPQNGVVPSRATLAAAKAPAEIAPWYGPTRGFSFDREVQPVLDAHCVRCHDGSAAAPSAASAIPDFRKAPPVHPQAASADYNHGTAFPPAYLALRSYVRSPTIESDMHLLGPGEFHADATALVQLLSRGHQGVRLEPAAWDRLITWIDLGTPAHGTWSEIVGKDRVEHQRDRRRAMLARYAARDEDPEAVTESRYEAPGTPAAVPGPAAPVQPVPAVAGWPFDAARAAALQSAGGPAERHVDLGEGVTLRLARIPAGEFVMGGTAGSADEEPPRAVAVPRPFWLGRYEITNEQYARFDPGHDSRLETGDFLQFSEQERGYPTNGPDQPVCRVSWDRAAAFCRWLSERAGEPFMLPSEAEWEYACRAGTDTPLWYGAADAGFADSANLADACLRRVDTFGWGLPSGAVPPWRPAIEAVDDGFRVSAPVGSFRANPWGLHDLHGNVAEWTRTVYGPGPTAAESDIDALPADARMVVRGGSWYDRPQWARSSSRAACRRYLGRFDVGFRVMSHGASGTPGP